MFQSGQIERAGEFKDTGYVVDGQTGLHLIEEPEALLGEGEREFLGAGG